MIQRSGNELLGARALGGMGALLVHLMACAGHSIDTPQWHRVQRAGDFVLHSDLRQEYADALLAQANRALGTVTRRFRDPGSSARQPYVIIAFGNATEYELWTRNHLGGMPPIRPIAYHCEKGGEVVLSWSALLEEPDVLAHTVSHEVTHQFLRRAFGAVPEELWLAEGLPEHVACGQSLGADFGPLELVVRAGYERSMVDVIRKPLPRVNISDEEWLLVVFPAHLLLDMLRDRRGDRLDEWLGEWARGEKGASSLVEDLSVNGVSLDEEWQQYVEERYLAYLEYQLQSPYPEARKLIVPAVREVCGTAFNGTVESYRAWRSLVRLPLGLVRQRTRDEIAARWKAVQEQRGKSKN